MMITNMGYLAQVEAWRMKSWLLALILEILATEIKRFFFFFFGFFGEANNCCSCDANHEERDIYIIYIDVRRRRKRLIYVTKHKILLNKLRSLHVRIMSKTC
jgi:hypothetical protein